MITIPEKDPNHGPKVELTEEQPAFDPPPTYASSSSPPPAPSPASAALTNHGRVTPSNYISLDRENNSIKGTYTIDPLITIPKSLLPTLAAGETEANRKNLKLYAKNGSIDVNINLLANTGKEVHSHNKRVTLDVGSQNGSVKVNLRRIGTLTSGMPIPFHLKAGSRNGSVTVGIPRTFEGLLTIYTKNGSVRMSDGVTQRVTIHNEEKGTQRCFLGDISIYDENEGGWIGDQLDVSAYNGGVKLHFVEEAGLEGPKKSGLFFRILGIS